MPGAPDEVGGMCSTIVSLESSSERRQGPSPAAKASSLLLRDQGCDPRLRKPPRKFSFILFQVLKGCRELERGGSEPWAGLCLTATEIPSFQVL